MKNLNNIKKTCIDDRFDKFYNEFSRQYIYRNWPKLYKSIKLNNDETMLTIAISPKKKMIAYTIIYKNLSDPYLNVNTSRIIELNKVFQINLYLYI